MDFRRLFHVLVVAGGSLAAGCQGGARTGPLGVAGEGGQAVADAEATPEAAAEAAAPASEAGAEAAPPASPCFCSPTRCCDQHGGGPATVQPGFECCWGTSC